MTEPETTAPVDTKLPLLQSTIHPLGVVTASILALGLLFKFIGTSALIGNLLWWHWLTLLLLTGLAAKVEWLHKLRLALESISTVTGYIAGKLGWMVFILALFNVVTRYTGRYVEKDILIGEVTSLAWMTFAFLFLIGLNYGVREDLNPRIDFWWADFSQRRKAWLDFVVHLTLFLPFVIMGGRILWNYSRISLGMKRDGSWPDGWQVWNGWEQSPDAGQLPVGPIKAIMLVGFILFGLQVFAQIIKTGFVLMGREDLADIHATDAPIRIE